MNFLIFTNIVYLGVLRKVILVQETSSSNKPNPIKLPPTMPTELLRIFHLHLHQTTVLILEEKDLLERQLSLYQLLQSLSSPCTMPRRFSKIYDSYLQKIWKPREVEWNEIMRFWFNVEKKAEQFLIELLVRLADRYYWITLSMIYYAIQANFWD